MYPVFLTIHSLFRWLVLGSLLFALYRAYKGWFAKQTFSKFDNSLKNVTVRVIHIQFLLGICLYWLSPIVTYFYEHFKEAIHQRQFRFFGMEHSLMMLLAISIITIGSRRVSSKLVDQQKFKTMAIWFTIGLLMILSSIPWGGSLMVERPFVRTF